MKFLLDENIEGAIVKFLRTLGHDVSYLSEIKPRAKDDEVLNIANEEQRILITNDKDFGEFCFLQHKAKIGILLLRFENENTSDKIITINKIINQFNDKLANHFIVASATKIRIRPI